MFARSARALAEDAGLHFQFGQCRLPFVPGPPVSLPLYSLITISALGIVAEKRLITMSLTSFLEQNADVRAKFLAHFTKPEFRVKSPLLAPPLTTSYGLAGTAFDYLLRFAVEKLNPRQPGASGSPSKG